jgi:hypothetical protein
MFVHGCFQTFYNKFRVVIANCDYADQWVFFYFRFFLHLIVRLLFFSLPSLYEYFLVLGL